MALIVSMLTSATKEFTTVIHMPNVKIPLGISNVLVTLVIKATAPAALKSMNV